LALWVWTGSLLAAVILVIAGYCLTAWICWRRLGDEVAGSSAGDFLAEKRHRATLRKQWPLACKAGGLMGPGRDNPPRLGRVKTVGTGTLEATVVSGKIGVPVFAIQKAAVTVAEVVGCREVIVTPTEPGVCKIAFHWNDPVGRHLALADLPLANSGQLAYGIRQDGTVATVKATQSILIGGLTQHGKSNTVWVLLADCIRQNVPVRLYVSDPKGGVELDALEAAVGASGGLITVRQYAKTPAETIKMIADVEKAMHARQFWMKEHNVRKVAPSVENPLVVLILDETLPLTDILKKGTDSPLGRVAYTGSAAAYVVWANTQVAQIDALGRFRDLIPQRICFATSNPQVTDSVLGQGAHSAGATCSEIRTPGVGFSYSEGQHAPRKFRAAHITDEETRLIASGMVPAAVMEMAEAAQIAGKGETALYRHFDAEGRLLYVGITNNYRRRSGEHEDSKPWWRLVASTTVERFPTRKEAEAAEKAAIKTEWPEKNDLHAPDRRPHPRKTREALPVSPRRRRAGQSAA
jgi:S-DNA-T family DNA segregation ATPase FtsK/SpoIIIE